MAKLVSWSPATLPPLLPGRAWCPSTRPSPSASQTHATPIPYHTSFQIRMSYQPDHIHKYI
eukprot:scaffold373745_cov22-Prasinocladus_malaysianus.AAC.1